MNKKIISGVAASVIMVIIGLWSAVRTPSIGNAHTVLSLAIKLALGVLAFPLKLYADWVNGHGEFPIPVLVLLLVLSGLFWGLIVERLVAYRQRRRIPPVL